MRCPADEGMGGSDGAVTRTRGWAPTTVPVRGEGPVAVLPQIGILLGLTIVVGAIAVSVFRWDDA